MDAPKEVKRVPLVIYSNGERHVVGWAGVNLISGEIITTVTSDQFLPLMDDIKFSDWKMDVDIDVSTREVLEVNYGLGEPKYKNLAEIFPHSALIHPSHKMVRFSDVPWGCRTCGACECHHLPYLCAPCIDPYAHMKEGTDAG